jgi:hypothetical protein
MDHKNNCFICGKELLYLDINEDMECCYCKETHSINVRCTDGHYLCDKCHSLAGNNLIEKYCVNSILQDPLEMAVSLMRNPQVKMHGPEHHFLVPAVVLSAYWNTIHVHDGRKQEALAKARERAEKVAGGFCGFQGDCGAAVGTGIMMSVLTGATPLSKQEWRLSNLMTAKSLFTIANNGGPRCCKRNSFLAINEAAEFLKEHLEITVSINKNIRCEFFSLNKECLEAECPFYIS